MIAPWKMYLTIEEQLISHNYWGENKFITHFQIRKTNAVKNLTTNFKQFISNSSRLFWQIYFTYFVTALLPFTIITLQSVLDETISEFIVTIKRLCLKKHTFGLRNWRNTWWVLGARWRVRDCINWLNPYQAAVIHQ